MQSPGHNRFSGLQEVPHKRNRGLRETANKAVKEFNAKEVDKCESDEEEIEPKCQQMC
jgi:hypothetical protein